MAAAGHPEDTPDRAASAIERADFVRLVSASDGDSLAAAGLLARGLEAAAIPYQASSAAVPEPPATDADCTVGIGRRIGDVSLRERSRALEAASILEALAPDAVDPELALAGAVSAGVDPPSGLLERAGLERRPGVAVPTDDPAEGLAFSTLAHAAFSGDVDAAGAAVSGLGTEDPTGREVASLLALSAIEDAPPRAATAIERALRPYATDRFETLGGYADVLDAAARTEPATGLALALGYGVEGAAYDAWRALGGRVHAALRSADTRRYDGLYVVRPDEATPAVLGSLSRLAFWYRSPEPTALAATDGASAVVGEEPTGDPFSEAAAALEGRTTAGGRAATATFEGTADEFVAAFRRAL
ncbi:hypothetical protein [Natronomonas sp.]|uniref:hypothetical protein n=1 Tax=Natronomonas sp. TaxID=2184060 RepID=UPI0026249CD8|nr:hypothetical protein [Natronomonas sp.]